METFQKTLGNFIHDFASGDAVRHLADNGLTVDEIVKRLDFPTPKTKVAEIVFQHYIDKGKITLTKPEGAIKSVTYVKRHLEALPWPLQEVWVNKELLRG